MTFVAVEPIGFSTVSPRRLGNEVAGIPFQGHVTAKEMTESRFYSNAKFYSVFEQQERINPGSLRSAAARSSSKEFLAYPVLKESPEYRADRPGFAISRSRSVPSKRAPLGRLVSWARSAVAKRDLPLPFGPTR